MTLACQCSCGQATLPTAPAFVARDAAAVDKVSPKTLPPSRLRRTGYPPGAAHRMDNRAAFHADRGHFGYDQRVTWRRAQPPAISVEARPRSA
jgi:hypothetical protein